MTEPQAEIDALTRALELHSLRILVAIRETGSISAAARALGYTQPTITQHVQRLESRLGATLVARSARSAHLTPAGELLARHAPRIDASLTAAATELAGLLGRRAGAVRLTGPPESIGPVLAPVSAWLDADSPSLEVTVIEAGIPTGARHGARRTRRPAIVFDIVGPGHRPGRYRRASTRSTFLFAEEIVALTAVEVDVSGDRVDPTSLPITVDRRTGDL